MSQPLSAIQLHDQYGSLTLHTRAGTNTYLRVRLLPEGELETLGRNKDGSWDKESVAVCPRFLSMIAKHLGRREAYGQYFYMDRRDVEVINRRFVRSKT